MAHFPASRARGYSLNREVPCRLTRLALALRIATALAAPAVALWPAAAALAQIAPTEQARTYRIPAGPLAENLSRFADNAGVTVLFDAALVGQRRGAGLNGDYAVADGFARLLAGSGLAARERSPGVFVLQALPSRGVTQLTPVTVEGEGAAVTPAWETRSDRKRLDDAQVRGWSDLGKRLEPGVNFNRQNNSINIRGLDQDRVLTRVDGIRLPWLDDGARGVKGGLEAVDFNSLSRLDIVRGVDASAGGSGAISGMADLYTLDPSDLLSDGKTFGALAKTDYDTADSSWGANAALAGQIHRNTFWLVQAGVRNGHALDNRGDVGGYGPRRSEPTPEDYDQRSFLLKLQQRVEGGHRFGLTGEYFKRKATQDSMFEQGPGTSYLIGENATRKETERERVSFDYAYKAPGEGGWIDSATAVVYWQRMQLDSALDGERSRDARANIIPGDPFSYGFPSGAYGRNNSIRQTMFGANGELTKRLAGNMVSQLWTVGGEWYGNKTEQNSSGYDNCPTVRAGTPAPFGPRTCDMLHTNQADVPLSKGSQWALWMSDEFSFGDGRYTVMPALRYDHYEQKPRSTESYASNRNGGVLPPENSGGRFSPKLLTTWKAADELSLYAQYAYGFKAPSATQLYTNYGGPGTYLRVGNPYLKPETSKGWELGAKLGSDSLGGAVSFFDNRYQNFIDSNVPLDANSPQWQPGWAGQYPLGITGNVNRAKVRIYGAEASAHWKFSPGWRTWGSLAWAVGKDEGTGQYLNSVAPLKAVLGVGYGRDVWGVDALLTTALRRNKVEYPEAGASTPNRDFQAPGYGVVDLMGYWRPTAVKGLQVQAGVFNLFDKKYWEAINVPTAGATALPRPVDWYTEPGRSLRVSLTYQY
ncbi:TonB-dependent receptor [Achromobacter ruhlandii]|jgi:hemoglobin/transferrin/lactoferrin receptor protein|uniref:TonB-dependent receptor n=1 Tax=Achromobacter ruhlandii TaxID=72557 RepID=UPI002433254E|nr:TonB-dependent receptor [Achromobacter ruhlandii]MCI1836204.1 TonB-dependent hemoglobin/transferrin/lactoferrin family receptor [Achromobacter ruhlandii]